MRRRRIVDRRALLLDLGDLLGHARKPLPQPLGLPANPDGLIPSLLRAGRDDRSHPDLRDHGLSSTGLPNPATTNSQTGFRNTLSSVNSMIRSARELHALVNPAGDEELELPCSCGCAST
jgi:hypothetical protein